MPEPSIPRPIRDYRVNFDVSAAERRAMQETAQALGLTFTSWARMLLLEASRAAFRDSLQHPTLYGREAIAPPPPVREPAPRLPVAAKPSAPVAAAPAPSSPAAPSREVDPETGLRRFAPPPRVRVKPYYPDDGDGDGFEFDEVPGAQVVPGLGTVKFQ